LIEQRSQGLFLSAIGFDVREKTIEKNLDHSPQLRVRAAGGAKPVQLTFGAESGPRIDAQYSGTTLA